MYLILNIIGFSCLQYKLYNQNASISSHIMCGLLIFMCIYAIVIILYSHKLASKEELITKSFQLEKRLQLKEQLKSLEN